MKVLSISLVVLLFALRLPAAVVFSDNFSYADGALTNAAPAVWLEHAGGAPLQVVGGQAQISSTLAEDVHAALTGQPYATGSGVTLYASFTVKFTALPTAGGSYFAHFNTSTFRTLVWASTANAASGFRLGIGNTTSASATTGQWATDLALNTTYTVVTRYVVGTGVSTLWLNPASESDPSVTATDATSAVSLSNFSLRQASGEGTLLLDNLLVGTSFSDVVSGAPSFPTITAQPTNQTVNAGGNATFSIAATGSPAPTYQWKFNSTNLLNETNATLTLNSVATNQAGNYFVTITNVAGATNSQTVMLTVNVASPVAGTNSSITLMTYNVKGNGVTDWSTNAAQVLAIGRQIQFLKPDVITFNEIPRTNVWQMANWVTAFMPGYYLATNSGSDGFINCVIASRHPINRSKSWLDGADLNPFGYTNANYTRDLFEAEINVPNWSLPLHVFTTHLKSSSGGYTEAAAKRAAEAAAITNFLATNFFVLYPTHPFTLAGDMNEADTNTPAIQRLLSAPTTLRLQNPTNPFSGSINTYSSDSPGSRIDYIFPCAMLASNITARQVFRTDLLNPTPTNLLKYDATNASDHLPVLMTFANPFNTPYKFTSFTRTNQSVTLKWEAQTNRSFSVEASTNLLQWTALASNLFATGTNFTFTTNNVSDQLKFFRLYRVP